MFFSLFIGFLVLERLFELRLANRNKRWILEQGGYEVGQGHYRFIVLLHVSFMLSLITEVLALQRDVPSWWMVAFTLFAITQVLRVWILLSLGKRWNTRIMVLPQSELVQKGPYRYMKHPNYMIVAAEILVIPLLFQAYITAFVFSVLNAFVLLFIRIPAEEKALQNAHPPQCTLGWKGSQQE